MPGRHQYEGLFIHETLVDLVLDLADLQVCTKAVRRSRGLRKLHNIESQLETVNSMAQAVSGLPEKVSTRICRLRRLVLLMKAAWGCQDVNTVGGPYQKAAAVWRSGVHRHDRVERTVLGELPEQVYVVTEVRLDRSSDDESEYEDSEEEEDSDGGYSQFGIKCDCGECDDCGGEASEDSGEEESSDDDDGHYDGNDYPMSGDALKFW